MENRVHGSATVRIIIFDEKCRGAMHCAPLGNVFTTFGRNALRPYILPLPRTTGLRSVPS